MSDSTVVAFEWSVPPQGHEWVRAYHVSPSPRGSGWEWDGPGWVLVEREPVSGFRTPGVASIADHPALFRTLASVDLGDREAVRGFADRYGQVVPGRPALPTAAAPTPLPELVEGYPGNVFARGAETRPGVSAEAWAATIGRMRRAVELADLITTRDVRGLSRLIRRDEGTGPGQFGDNAVGRSWYSGPLPAGGAWWYDTHPDVPLDELPGPLGGRGYAEVSLTETPAGPPVIAAAVRVLFNEINAHLNAPLSGHRRAPDGEWHNVHSEVHVEIRSGDSGVPGLRLVPNSLYAAMWLQLARAIAGNKEYRTCKDCGQWFEVSADDDGRTARRLFCTDTCKNRDYRRRRGQAVELRAAGKSPREIADVIGTDVETVRKWTTRKRRGG